MKKFTITALVIGFALMLAVPSMAVDIKWDGYLRVRGFLEQNAPMNNNEDSYNAYYDMRWRTNWTLTVNDYLRIRSRWRALNQDGGEAGAGFGDQTNFEFERAWMLVQTPYGLFEAGRMITQVFGTSFLDNEVDVFRLNYSTKIADKVVFVATVQKAAEGDGGDINPGNRWTTSDNDIDVYAFALVYPTENWTIGSLQVLLRNAIPGNGNTMRYSADPYFTGKFGNLALQAEGQFFLGDAGNTAAGKSIDYKAYAFNAEGTYDLGPAAVQLGFAYCSGDSNATDDEVNNLPLGSDWEKFYLLFGTTGNAVEDLGSVGNFAQPTNTAGFTSVYGGVSTNLTEKLNVGLSAAWAMANKTPNNINDKAGTEVDLRVNWTFYDNLEYQIIGAYLFAGDYWKDSSKANDPTYSNDDNPWAIFHALQLNF
jgi:hypothetical protein